MYIDDKIYFNPASNDVKELIVNGVKEIVENYAVDAIHFDDYFYPSKSKEVDKNEYSAYVKSGEIYLFPTGEEKMYRIW